MMAAHPSRPWLGISMRSDVAPIERGGWLDALRFIVAFMIILHHYDLAAPTALQAFHPVFERGYLLTDFFLIDSGYVLGRIYARHMAARDMGALDFFRKRALRVVPAHLLMSLALIFLMGVAALAGLSPRHPEWFDWRELPAQFFLVQSYGVPGGRGWNAPTWTMSALLGCYLCFPYLSRALGRISPWHALAAGIGLFAIANLLTWQLLNYPVYQMPLQYGFLRALPLFFLGMALARFSDKVFIPANLARVAGAAAAVALALFQAYGRFSLVSISLICLIIVAAGAIPVKPGRTSRLVERLAVASFSMFITNEVVRIGYFGVENALEARIGWPVWVGWVLWTGGVFAAVVFAMLFHYLVDMPTQGWLKRWRRVGGRDGKPAAAPGAAPAVPAE